MHAWQRRTYTGHVCMHHLPSIMQEEHVSWIFRESLSNWRDRQSDEDYVFCCVTSPHCSHPLVTISLRQFPLAALARHTPQMKSFCLRTAWARSVLNDHGGIIWLMSPPSVYSGSLSSLSFSECLPPPPADILIVRKWNPVSLYTLCWSFSFVFPKWGKKNLNSTDSCRCQFNADGEGQSQTVMWWGWPSVLFCACLSEGWGSFLPFCWRAGFLWRDRKAILHFPQSNVCLQGHNRHAFRS